MTVPERHQLKIARATMKMSCVGARIMGGMDHAKASRVIKKITGRTVYLDNDCECLEDCGCCGCEHPVGFNGDCRDDDNRF